MSSGVVLETVSDKEAGTRLDRWIKRRVQISQGQVEKLLRTGQVRVDGARAKSSTRLETGQEVRLPPFSPEAYKGEGAKTAKSEGISPRDAAFIRDLVIYQDDDVIALNKPAGIAVQGGTKQGRHLDGMLGALAADGERPKLVHRLDRDTSGVLVLARHPRAAAELGELFRSREMDKVYWAVTIGVPNPRAGQLRSWMVKGQGSGDMREIMVPGRQGQEGARHAITDYATVSTAGQKAAWVACKPVTGRTHQIRFHLQELGTAILGDPKYKTEREVPGGVGQGLHLHAKGIILPRGTGRDVEITAPLPPHLAESFAALGFLEEEAGSDLMEPFL
ncbi:MAG: RluA family pseudouridine synthase [Pseudomonadota bacterium]